MVKEIARQVEIPEGVAVTVDGNTVTVKGPKGEVSRQLSYPEIEIKKEDSQLIVNSRLDRKQPPSNGGDTGRAHQQYDCRRKPRVMSTR